MSAEYERRKNAGDKREADIRVVEELRKLSEWSARTIWSLGIGRAYRCLSGVETGGLLHAIQNPKGTLDGLIAGSACTVVAK